MVESSCISFSVGWHHIKTAGHTSAKTVLGWISPILKGFQIHCVISLVWIARVAEALQGQTPDRVDTVDLSDLFIGIMALVSARVSFNFLWQRIDPFFLN